MPKSLRQRRHVEPNRLARTNEDGIERGLEEQVVLEVLRERRRDRAQVLGGEFVQRHPLTHDAARIESFTNEPVVLRRVQIRGAVRPRVDRIGGDDVERARSRLEKIAAVLHNHGHTIVVDGVAVEIAEDPRCTDHGGFDFDERDFVDAGMRRDAAQRQAGAQTDHERRSGVWMQERRQMSQHVLVVQVRVMIGRNGLAVDQHGARLLRFAHRHGRRSAFLVIQDLRSGELTAHVDLARSVGIAERDVVLERGHRVQIPSGEQARQ